MEMKDENMSTSHKMSRDLEIEPAEVARRTVMHWGSVSIQIQQFAARQRV
jgi:hypothetical protein